MYTYYFTVQAEPSKLLRLGSRETRLGRVHEQRILDGVKDGVGERLGTLTVFRENRDKDGVLLAKLEVERLYP